jgi:extradiol dioxygenase family protein
VQHRHARLRLELEGLKSGAQRIGGRTVDYVALRQAGHVTVNAGPSSTVLSTDPLAVSSLSLEKKIKPLVAWGRSCGSGAHAGTASVASFHRPFPVDDLAAAGSIHGGVLGCPEGTSSDEWTDLDRYGHRIVAHLAPKKAADHHNPVDCQDVPVQHFGVVLDWDDFHALAERPRAGGMRFFIEPYVRFADQVGEQATSSSATPAATRWSS